MSKVKRVVTTEDEKTIIWLEVGGYWAELTFDNGKFDGFRGLGSMSIFPEDASALLLAITDELKAN